MDALDDLLTWVDAGELGDPLPVLAYIAGQSVEIDDEDLNGGRRRDLDVDDRAVKALAADLYTDERREQLGRSIDALVLQVRERPVAREAALFLAADVDLAWRLFSLSLLAEE